MNNYRKKIKIRMVFFLAIVLIAVGVSIFDVFILDIAGKDNIQFTFMFGLAVGFGLVSAIRLFNYRGILKDESKLVKEYNIENDERNKEIRAKAGMPIVMLTSSLMIIAAIIAGYFNIAVFITLVAAALVQMTICTVVKLVYMKKI